MIEQFQYGFLENNIEENLTVFKKNFDIVLTYEDASFNIVNTLLNINYATNSCQIS